MGVKLHNSSSSSLGDGDSTSGRPCHRVRYNTSHLPFPNSSYYNKWRCHFVPTLLAWTGSQEDPFGANSQMARDSEITTIWTWVFPDLEELDGKTIPIVHSVVCAFSRTCMAHGNVL